MGERGRVRGRHCILLPVGLVIPGHFVLADSDMEILVAAIDLMNDKERHPVSFLHDFLLGLGVEHFAFLRIDAEGPDPY